MTIRERIEAAEKVIASLPDWAKKNLHWDGGDNNPSRAIRPQESRQCGYPGCRCPIDKNGYCLKGLPNA
jgi:hypothetical protein